MTNGDMEARYKAFAAVAAVIIAVLGLWALSRGGEETGAPGIDLGPLGLGAGSSTPGAASEGGTRYAHLDPEFSIAQTDEWTVSNFAEGEGETVLVRRPDGAEAQIFMRPFDDESPITAERISREIPGMGVREPQPVALDGAQALAFASGGEGGETYEVWLSRAGYLYQVSAPLRHKDMVQALVTGWRW